MGSIQSTRFMHVSAGLPRPPATCLYPITRGPRSRTGSFHSQHCGSILSRLNDISQPRRLFALAFRPAYIFSAKASDALPRAVQRKRMLVYTYTLLHDFCGALLARKKPACFQADGSHQAFPSVLSCSISMVLGYSCQILLWMNQ